MKGTYPSYRRNMPRKIETFRAQMSCTVLCGVIIQKMRHQTEFRTPQRQTREYHDRQCYNHAERATNDNTITTRDHEEPQRPHKQKRNTTPNCDRQAKRDTSKMIKKKIRTIENEEMRNKIANIWSTFRGLKNTTSIKPRKKILTTHTQDKDGINKYDRQDTADVVAELYEEFHTSTTKTLEHEHEDKHE